MDVTCERCGTVYEFDETLLSGRGTTVKCTQCSHVFKVMPPGAAGGSGWQVRRGDGSTESLGSLKELQHRIAASHLAPDDVISRDGETWKKLGDIAELQSFFAVSQATAAAPPPPKREHQPTEVGVGSVGPPPEGGRPPAGESTPSPSGPSATPTRQDSDETAAPAQREHKPTLMGMGGGASATSAPTVASDDRPPTGEEPHVPGGAPGPSGTGEATVPARPSPSSDAPTAGGWAEGPGLPAQPAAPPESPSDAFADTLRAIDSSRATGPSARRSAPTVEAAPRPPPNRPDRHAPMASPSAPAAPPTRRPAYLDEGDEGPPELPGSGRAWWWALAVLLLAAAGVGAWLAWPQISEQIGQGEETDPLTPFLERAEAALAEDHADAYEEALREYTRATALDEDDPRVLIGMSEAHALWAQELLFDARDLQARAAEDPTLAGEAARARREAARHAREARTAAERAGQAGGESPTTKLALADALRVSGDAHEARQIFMDARRGFHPAPADLHRIAGLLAMAEAEGDPAAARSDAQKAVERDPDLIRARLLLARAMLAGKEPSAARQQLEAIFALEPGHPRAEDLKRAIDEGIPPAAPLVAVLDGGTAKPDGGAARDGGSAADAGAPTEAETARAREGAATGSTGGVPAGREYGWYVSRGDQFLERGDVGRAKQYFEAALRQRPNGSEALSGLGYVALNQGSTAEAIRRFRPATSRGYADAFIGLGDAYRRAGRYREALEAYQGYLERRPNGSHATIARRQVRAMTSELGETTTEKQGGTTEGTAPPTPADTLPAPKDTEPGDLPPADPPAVESD